MACLLEEIAYIARESIKRDSIVTERTYPVVHAIGIPQTCIIVSASVMPFPLPCCGKYIINCDTSRLDPMIKEKCIGAVIGGLCCIVTIKSKHKL